MDLESLEARIDELEFEKRKLRKKIEALKRTEDELRGRIKEIWEQIDSWKEIGEFGTLTREGDARVFKLPVFGNEKDVANALAGGEAGPQGESLAEVKQAREQKGKSDGQQAVDIMDGQSPLTVMADGTDYADDGDSER